MSADDVGQPAASRMASGVREALKRRLRLALTLDHALVGAGVAAACCSAAFAGYMASDNDRQPHFFGEQYLAIFAKPSRSLQAAAHPSPVLESARASPSVVDPTPTGSIPSVGSEAPADGQQNTSLGHRLIPSLRGAVWIASDSGFREAQVGDVLPKFGRVKAIEFRDGQWVALMENGTILKSNLSAAARSVFFGRSMIFDH